MIHVALVVVIYGAIFGLAEILRSLFKVESESTRKTVHVLSGLAALTFPRLISLAQLFWLATGFFAALMLSQRTGWLPSIHKVSRRTLGAMVFPLAIFFTASITWPQHLPAYTFAILTMTMADTAAAIFGRGKKTSTAGSRLISWRGTLAFFVVTVMVVCTSFFLEKSRPATGIVILTPLLLTLIERYTPYGLDNLTIPIAAAVLWSL